MPNHRPVQPRIKLAQFPQRTVPNVKARFTSEVENTKQVVLLGNIFRAAHFVTRDVEREEFPQAGRLDLQHSFGIVGIVKRQDVETQTIADVP